MTPDVALIICRFFSYAAAIFLWGGSAYLCGLAPPELSHAVDRGLRRLNFFAILLLTASTFALLPLRAATIGAGWGDALNSGTVRSILFETNIGRAWIVQACAVALLISAGSWPHRHTQGARATCAALLLIGLTITGHAAMDDGWLRALHRINDALHLLSGGAWLGALIPVLRILFALDDPCWHAEARVALTRFSTAGHIAVALVLLTGINNTLLIVGGLPTDWSLPYQFLLCMKILAVAGMVGMAIVNRYVLVPRLYRSSSLRALKCSTTTMIGLGLTTLALVAWFATLQPV